MYSGTTFRTKSGRVVGVHQKIDRVAYRHLLKKLPRRSRFPSIQQIIHFEGLNGPDGIKRKSPAKDEPWHYIDPDNTEDHVLLEMIQDHIVNMAAALRENNEVRAAFEAAWMAHAIVDGLTPAHHYPLEEKIEELWGKPKDQRLTIRDKNIIRGKSRRDTLSKNWQYWGAKGVFTTHVMFEWGVASSIAALRFDELEISKDDYKRLTSENYEVVYKEILKNIANMKMYEEYIKIGWSRHLARETRDNLIPEIIRAVVLGWYKAFLLAKEER